MTINVENILKVADAIERHSVAELGFNMNYEMHHGEGLDRSGHKCTAVACIIGWTNTVFGEQYVSSSNAAAEHLGLDPEFAYGLFFPDHDRWGIDTYDRITPAEAATALRVLARTGEIDWSHIDAAP